MKFTPWRWSNPRLLPAVCVALAASLAPLAAQDAPRYACVHGQDLRLRFVRGQEFIVTSPGGYWQGRLTNFEEGALEELGSGLFRAREPGQGRIVWTYWSLDDRQQERPFRVTVTVDVADWGAEPRELYGAGLQDVVVGQGETFRIRTQLGVEDSIVGVDPGPGLEVVDVERTPAGGIRRVTLRASAADRLRLDWLVRDAGSGEPRKHRMAVLASTVAGGSRYHARALSAYAYRDFMPGNEAAGKLRAKAELLLRNPGSEPMRLTLVAIEVVTPAGRARVPLGREVVLEPETEERIEVGYPTAGEIDLDGESARLEIVIQDEGETAEVVRTWTVPVRKTS